MIKRNNKKGFTIVELVIVIAVIAILAAVLIPTFAGIIKKANISADTQLCKNMNTALSMAKAEGETLDDMEDVLRAINEAGYVIENLNPTTEGYYFAWDEANGQILFLNNEFAVHYPEDAELNAAKCWITVGDAKEAADVAAKGFALYLEPGFDEALTLSALVSVDAGVNTIPELSIKSDAAGSIVVSGAYDNVTLNIPNADAVQHGVIDTFDVEAVKVGTLRINGFVKALTLTAGKVVVEKTGVVSNATVNGGEISAEGIILEGAGATSNEGKIVEISSKAELEAFRDIVNGGYYYDGVTVKLTADIDLAGTAWTPIGNFYKKDADNANNSTNGFMGTFDGNGHTIKNLSNKGFSVVDLKFGSDDTTPANADEAVYGLFASIINATIKNLKVTADIDMMQVGDKLGDSIGIIAGYAYASANKSVTIENCSVSGTVKGYDSVGGLVGRFNAENSTNASINFTECTNNATVTGQRKTAGILATAANRIVNMTKCANAANITSIGAEGDIEPINSATNYYVAASHLNVTNGTNARLTLTDCTNSGTVTCTCPERVTNGNIK